MRLTPPPPAVPHPVKWEAFMYLYVKLSKPSFLREGGTRSVT